MSNPIILSDDDDHKTPLLKKARTVKGSDPAHTILVIDDPTPQKPGPACYSLSSSPSVVPETPMSEPSIVKCKIRPSIAQIKVSSYEEKFVGSDRLVSLESENEESESGSGAENCDKNNIMGPADDELQEIGWSSRDFGSLASLGDAHLKQKSRGISSQPTILQDDINQVHDYPDKENFSMEQMGNIIKQKRTEVSSDAQNSSNEAVGKKKMTKEERIHIAEERRLKKEQEKLQKAALKAQAAELRKMEKERKKWEKGKFALKSIVAEFDTKVVEQGSVGGHLLSRFADKGLTYRITSNPIERSIMWTMSVPQEVSQLSPEASEIQYLLLVYNAKEFCDLVINESLIAHVSSVRSCYPSHTICYLTNRLMAYINKREKQQYKNLENDNGWRCPPIEEVLAKLTTHFAKVHYRHCMDEAELAEHIVGLTSSLASCQFRKKLTRLSVNANGSLIPKDFVDKNLIKKSPWLKALVAIPKVQPRFAIAIWKKYPTMRSLLSVYMDPSKSVHEKEFLLKDLMTEGIIGGERRVGEICSKRVYRILMAQSANIKTEDIENGADFFRHQSS